MVTNRNSVPSVSRGAFRPHRQWSAPVSTTSSEGLEVSGCGAYGGRPIARETSCVQMSSKRAITRIRIRASATRSPVSTYSSTACARSRPGVPSITAGIPRSTNSRMSAP
jgi:hypothetical protein